MQDAAVSAEVAYAVRSAFVDHFRQYLDGRQSKQATKQAVANLLIDEEPNMIDDFMLVRYSDLDTQLMQTQGTQAPKPALAARTTLVPSSTR